MDLISDFVGRYTKEYDFYSQAARLVHQKLEASLQAAGIRSIVTSRAKSIARLEEKCRQRNSRPNCAYSSVDEIYEDIVDLGGVRVALYFPGELEQVDGVIARLFGIILKKEFPDPDQKKPEKRFSGYSATHYRVQLKDDGLKENEKRYMAARIEIQVASVLMHAWSEVEHDLVYKPLGGDLSEDELAILDQLNGLVLAGEIAFERLQKSGEARVARGDRRIANHYDLAAHVLNAAENIIDSPVNEQGLGRVDLLFEFIRTLGIDTPDRLKPYIDALHGNVEVRPLSEQIVDALIAEDPERFGIYESIKAQRPWANAKTDHNNEVYQRIGLFMTRWAELEALLRARFPDSFRENQIPPTAWMLVRAHAESFSREFIRDFESVRRMRNMLVHDGEAFALVELDEETRRLEDLLAEIRGQEG
jgi:ppGpp synthetase/RelA/SpoT-type nucleotidyltranferase